MNGEGPVIDIETGQIEMIDAKRMVMTFALQDTREIIRVVFDDATREQFIAVLAQDMTPARKKKAAALLTPTARKTNRKR
jgi:hypothetical protein